MAFFFSGSELQLLGLLKWFNAGRINVHFEKNKYVKETAKCSVADPEPHSDPDQYVFGPPGFASVSVGHKYGSGYGSFHHQAKIERKTLLSTVL
jgi:hypothetical protein